MLLLATGFYFPMMREMNSIALMLPIMQLNKLEEHLQLSFWIQDMSYDVQHKAIPLSNWQSAMSFTSDIRAAQVVMILSLKVDFADLGKCQGRGY